MGERAKDKRAAESRAARKAKKASEQLEASEGPAPPSDLDCDPGPTGTSNVIQPPTRSTWSTSNIENSSTTKSTARQSTHQSARSQSSSSKLGEKLTSAKGETRPQRTSTIAANALLQQLHIGETESTDFEGESDNETMLL